MTKFYLLGCYFGAILCNICREISGVHSMLYFFKHHISFSAGVMTTKIDTVIMIFFTSTNCGLCSIRASEIYLDEFRDRFSR